MTLSVVAFFSALFDLGRKGFWFLGSIIMTFYEVFIQMFNGKNFIFFSERRNFFEMNREGILGVLGFFSIYLYSLSVGREIHNCEPRKEKLYLKDLVIKLLK